MGQTYTGYEDFASALFRTSESRSLFPCKSSPKERGVRDLRVQGRWTLEKGCETYVPRVGGHSSCGLEPLPHPLKLLKIQGKVCLKTIPKLF